MTQQEILSRFSGVRRSSTNVFYAQSPLRPEKKPSVEITFKGNKVLLRDHGDHEATAEKIAEAVGLAMQDLFLDNGTAPRRKVTYTQRERAIYGKENKGWKFVDCYDYTDVSGNYLYSKMRFTDQKGEKQILHCTFRENDYKWGKSEYVPHTLYNLPEFIKKKRGGEKILFCEGEKDVETLRSLGLCATTCGSAEEWHSEYAKWFTGADVIILPDNDKEGLNLAQRVQRDLYIYANSTVIVPTSTQPKGDVTDYLNEGHTMQDLLELLKQAEYADKVIYAPWLMVKKAQLYLLPDGTIVKKTNDPAAQLVTVVTEKKLNPDLLARWFAEGQDYLVSRNAIDDKDDLYLYRNGCYERTNKNGFDGKIKEYLPRGTATTHSISETHGLIVKDETEDHICTPADLDLNEDLINVQNGFYSISQGGLLPHTPEIKSTVQLQCRYRKEAERPVFDKFIHDFCSDDNGNYDESKEKVLQEYAGLILSNVDMSRVKKLLWLFSPMGNTGKSVFLHILSFILGGKDHKYTLNLPLQSMNEGAKFAVGSLQGRRLIAVGDQSATEVQDTSLLKSLTGGDLIKVEQKGKQPLYIRFRGGILIASNALPSLQGGDKGQHLFQRFLLVPAEYHVEKKKVDPRLREKLEAETDGIFTWALEGLKRLIANNYRFTECSASEAVIDEYRSQQDTMFRFIHENGYEITGNGQDRIVRSDFDNLYIQWCNDNELQPLRKAGIKQRLLSEGCGAGQGRIGDVNTTYYCGIKVQQNSNILPTKSPTKVQQDEEWTYCPEGELIFD